MAYGLSRLLAGHISCGFKREKSIKRSGGTIDQAAVPENHQGLFRINGVSTLRAK